MSHGYRHSYEHQQKKKQKKNTAPPPPKKKAAEEMLNFFQETVLLITNQSTNNIRILKRHTSMHVTVPACRMRGDKTPDSILPA